MKKAFLPVLLVALSPLVFAQMPSGWHERCGTVAYMEMLRQQDPALAFRLRQTEKEIGNWITSHPEANLFDTVIYTIPVVVHVLYNLPEQNITEDQVLSQIEALNQDYRRLNTDAGKTPVMFRSLAADCRIEFCLARHTPDSLPTNGILHIPTQVAQFQMDNNMKFADSGGSKAWDSNRYLNLWVCNLASNILGYAQMPGGPDSTDGVVINYQAFGTTGNLFNGYSRGRTATHEIGHWMDLWHIWGDDFGSCDGSDYVEDTPNQAEANYYCPDFPHPSCSNISDMFMNYMDYTDDTCMNMFTWGQKVRMRAALTVARPAILQSDGCREITGLAHPQQDLHLSVMPNPSAGLFYVTLPFAFNGPCQVSVFNAMGNRVLAGTLNTGEYRQFPVRLSDLPRGVYFLRVVSKDLVGGVKLLKI